MWTIVFGALMIVAGLVVLGHVLIATLVSVVFLGWFAVIGGLAGIISALFNIRRPGFWPALLGGALALAVGIAFLRRPGVGVAALTLLLGAALLVGGIARIVGGFGEGGESRAWVIANGVITLLLGLLILFAWPGSSLWVLGTFLGVELIVEGVTYIVMASSLRRALPREA
ncbi:MAG TPA: DUF308 domain-containing protein [Mycobacteriales bacterium]|nr:DUF308 domain-containing protein [Mycobacteriales bacterium]